MRTINHILPSCVCVCVCVCIFSPSLMQEAGFSVHNVQVAVLAMEDMLAWMEEGGQVGSLFFWPFMNRSSSILAKKKNQICNSGDLMGYVVLINVEVQSLSWIAIQQWLVPILSPPPQFSTNKRLQPMFALLMVQYILALMVKMLTDLPSHQSKLGINGKIIPSCYFLSIDFFLPIFVGWHLWCHQQHKCTSEHASEAGRRKVQGAAIFFFFTFLWQTHVSALASVHTWKLFSW